MTTTRGGCSVATRKPAGKRKRADGGDRDEEFSRPVSPGP
jgi:hypothetical protein